MYLFNFFFSIVRRRVTYKLSNGAIRFYPRNNRVLPFACNNNDFIVIQTEINKIVSETQSLPLRGHVNASRFGRIRNNIVKIIHHTNVIANNNNIVM